MKNRYSKLVVSCLILAVFAGPAPAEDAPTLAISGGMLVDGYGGLPVQNAVVLVAGDRITAVGDVNSVNIPDGVKTLDANGMTVLPGLWESHGHLFHIGEGDPASFPVKFKPRAQSIMAAVARTSLLAGITTFRDTGGPIQEQLALKRDIEAGKLPGPRLFLAGPITAASVISGPSPNITETTWCGFVNALSSTLPGTYQLGGTARSGRRF